MSLSPTNYPINVALCKTAGTIFSSGGSSGSGGGGGGGGTSYTFSNLGAVGARVYAQVIANDVQFRRLVQGRNTTVTERTNDILIETPDIAFDSSGIITRNIPGLVGLTPGKSGIIDLLNYLLYPTPPPTVGISLNQSQFEIGDTGSLTAAWNVQRTAEQILTISVATVSQTPTGNSQSGNQTVAKNGLADVIATIVATTLTQSATASAIASVGRKIRIGGTAKDGIISQVLDSDINGLTGFFSAGIDLPPKTIVVGALQYLAIEIPAIFGNQPIFKINGFVTNAFTKVRTNSAFANLFNFSEQVNVWVSNKTATGTITVEITH